MLFHSIIMSSQEFHCIAVIAKSISSKHKHVPMPVSSFIFNSTKWVQVTDPPIPNTNKFITDVRITPEFDLFVRTTYNNDQYLCLFLNTSKPFQSPVINVASRLRLINRFFDLTSTTTQIDYDKHRQTNAGAAHSQNYEIDECTDDISEISIHSLYDLLRQAHANDRIEPVVTADMFVTKLNPILRLYQNDAVNWMLNRERNTVYSSCEFVGITLRLPMTPTLANIFGDNINCNVKFFYNPRTSELRSDQESLNSAIPSGGILADEMGLGKTVEMLALILSNRRPFESQNINAYQNGKYG